MGFKPPVDPSRERSILVTLARLKKAGRANWFREGDVKELLDGLQSVTARRIADALIHSKTAKLSKDEQHDLSYLEQLATLR